jgi:signal transduction histidine kinase
MTKKKLKARSTGQSRFIILIFILVATLMVSSAVIEMRQSKKELLQLMTKQAHSLLESLIIASQNTLHASNYLESNSQQRLINNASLIKNLYESKQLTNSLLAEICLQNDIHRINIYNNKGIKIFSSHAREHFGIAEKHNPKQTLRSVFSGEQDTLIIGYREARYENEYRFAVALAASDRSVIVLNINASDLLNFKRDIDFGALIRKVAQGNPEIIYIALQDTMHILAASGRVKELEKINQSAFLSQSFWDSTFVTRTTLFDSVEIFEAVHPFSFAGEVVGLFRMGLSLEPIQDINNRIYRRLIIISIILSAIGFVLFVYIFTRQRLDLLQKQYQVVETYTGSIIENVSDAIIVLDHLNHVNIFNDAAERLFLVSRNKIFGKKITQLLTDLECFPEETTFLKQMSCKIGNTKKELLISKSSFTDHEENENFILVIRDLTEQKALEDQLQRQQRLTAMGEFASGVAHEIRNPLNAIGTIIQQLDKDFEPTSDKKEYHELAGLVYNEVKRINETVQDFLRFARPDPLQPNHFHIMDLFNQLKIQYQSIMDTQQIEFILHSDWVGEVFWDEKQIKQVFINLIQNAVEAIENMGSIWINVKSLSDQEIEITVKDNGPGMSGDTRANIFNLYYTTKAKGTGIGLSIVQRIIFEHGGIISVESDPKKGSIFTIKIPIKVAITDKK